MGLFPIPFNDKNDGHEVVQGNNLLRGAEGTDPARVMSKGTIGCPQGEL
jgi:hypothetical protein